MSHHSERSLHRIAIVLASVVVAVVATAPITFAHDVSVDARSSGRSVTPARASDSSDVIAVVNRFHDALGTGDSAVVLALLADDAVILESGGIETRDDYRAHHLPADIGFARAVPSERGPMRVSVRGDAAWVSGTSTTKGELRGRAINSVGAELVVLSRESNGWKIRAIHWSSRSRRS